MKKLYPSLYLQGIACLLLFSTLFIVACGTFPAGHKAYDKDDYVKADPKFEKSLDHAVYGPSAAYYRAEIRLKESNDVLDWIDIHQVFCMAEDKIKNLPIAARLKLKKYDADFPDVRSSRENLQKRIISRLSRNGTLQQLLALEANNSCWMRGGLDSLRAIIVNKTIDPSVEVFDTPEDKNWEGRPWPPEEMAEEEAGHSCWQDPDLADLHMTYREASIILNQYPEVVLPANYGKLWKFQSQIWKLFQRDENYCKMDSFRLEHPTDRVATACWMEEAQASLCSNSLKQLLAFFRDYPHTIIDVEVASQILCMSLTAPDAGDLNAAERQQLNDIKFMFRIQDQLLHCNKFFENEMLVDHVEDLSKRYKYHLTMYNLARLTLSGLARESEFALAKKALDRLQPLFPDTVACSNTNYGKMRDRQQWFDNFGRLLRQTEEESVIPIPMDVWNTPTHDEFSLVSWGETNEVFFVRANPATGERQILTSKIVDEEWTEPTVDEALSETTDLEPLSMSAAGTAMLFRSKGKLFISRRGGVGWEWGPAEEMDMHSRFAGNAWLSPNDSLLFAEYFVQRPTAKGEPKTDIAFSRLLPNGKYSRPTWLNAKINYEWASEDKASISLDGRLFFFTSNRPAGLGEQDMYSVSLNHPLNWSSMSEPRNLGLILNTPFHETGISYFSEYTGYAYFDREDRCGDSRDIYQVKLAPGVFPENAMRLAGLVVDENGKPIDGGGGFLEFTADYNLHVHSEPVSSKGTYSYTVKDSTEVVRLYPEIPGYYTAKDVTKIHFLADVKKGEIIRDTFRVVSFDYIRRNFKLKHSTFFHGTAQFDQPDKALPEINELARIATRMGANLVLIGHTDNTGTEEENLKLSIQRVEAVRDFLVNSCGFDPNRIRIVGYGSSRPICSNATEEGRRCNRRIEILFEMPELERR